MDHAVLDINFQARYHGNRGKITNDCIARRPPDLADHRSPQNSEMDDRQLTFKEDEITRMLNRAFDLFREGDFGAAERELEEALRIDFEYPDVTSSLKCANSSATTPSSPPLGDA